MSVVDTVVRLTRHIATRTAHAIVHPVETATGVADAAGSAAAAVVSAAKDADRDPVDWANPAPEDLVEPPEGASLDIPFPPEPPEPPVATEPKPADVDDWRTELDDLDDLEDVPAAAAHPDDGTPLVDPAVAKALRSEAATMRHAAERNPESTTEAG